MRRNEVWRKREIFFEVTLTINGGDVFHSFGHFCGERLRLGSVSARQTTIPFPRDG